ncbi:D-glycero-D-manno-heptose 1 [Elusimicrobium posterum]|uniref:D-glycero-alpha-D-manno-heptose-1,7-bisphosphate 7-phosphatase n=1 Tax=Elusimicrobium posterum TaxID=3116653 RepID=UPI003C707EE8
MKTNKAIFLDRDGTVIYEKPGVYLSDPDGVKLYKSTIPAFKIFKELGYKLFIVSNQSGIGRGYFTEKEVNNVHRRLQDLIKPYKIEEIVFCPHAPSEPCNCRKPKPLLGQKLIKKYNIDSRASFMIGDKKSDIDFGRAIGFGSILVRTANGNAQIKKYNKDIKADFTASNLLNAAKYIKRTQEES